MTQGGAAAGTNRVSAPAANFQAGQIPVLLGGRADVLKEWAARWETSRLLGYALVVFAGAGLYGAAMGALHLAFLLVSTYFGLRFLHAGFRSNEDRTGGGIKVWMAIFLLVMLQMTTAFRPWLGKADTFLPTEKKFFVSHWLDCIKQN